MNDTTKEILINTVAFIVMAAGYSAQEFASVLRIMPAISQVSRLITPRAITPSKH